MVMLFEKVNQPHDNIDNGNDKIKKAKAKQNSERAAHILADFFALIT